MMRFHFRNGCDSRPFAAMGPSGFSFGPGGRFHFDFGDDGEGRGDGSRRRGRRMFLSAELRRVLLKLIADEPRHGYDLIRAIEEMTHGEYSPSPGMVYPQLTMLEDIGRITMVPEEGSRKKYAVTEEGREYLDRHEEAIARLFERLEQSGEGRRRSSRPELGRAVGNLMAALRNRAAAEGWNEELLNEVIDILDEAARRIERAR